ncbi:MAG: hypothetical protein Q7T70_15245 [Polaromonas sp.]|nr:hypothetical protein [Polaromonas sp.]
MATKKKPSIVTPAEWKERTNLRLSSRGDTTKELDIAYERWYTAKYPASGTVPPVHYRPFATGIDPQAEAARRADIERYRGFLQDKLEKYLREHGASTKGGTGQGATWDRCERNKVSNGLLEFVYNTVKVEDPRITRVKGTIAKDNEHSRYGVLYLLGNIEINMEWAGIVLEGVGAVGGALASGFGTDYGELKNPDDVDKTIKGSADIWKGKVGTALLGKDDMSITDAYGYANDAGTGIIGAIHGKVTAPGHVTTYDRRSVVGATAIRRRATDVQMDWGAKGPSASLGNMDYLRMSRSTRVVSSPPPGQSKGWFPTTTKALSMMESHPKAAIAFFPVSAVAVVGAVAVDLMRKLLEVLYSLVTSFVEWLKGKLQEFMDNKIEVGADYVKKIVTKVVESVAKEALPFVSAGMDLAQGMYQSFQAIRMKVGAWLERRKIRITDGHPALLASRIEKCMSMDILSGLYTLIKGAVQMALAFLAAGAQGLISALTAGVEWCIKFIMRLMERSAIKSFLELAKDTYVAEKKLRDAAKNNTGAEMHATGGIINDLEKFKEFYQKGCSASPLIAMLTINSGICGSQWQLQQMIGAVDEIDQKEFNSGTKYFTRLKDYGTNYLKDSGFEFKATHEVLSEKRYIQALLDNAKNPKRTLPAVAAMRT